MKARRLEITVSEDTWKRLNDARGFEARASFVKRALESALGTEATGTTGGTTPDGPPASASSRASEPLATITVPSVEVNEEAIRKATAPPSKRVLPAGVKTGAQIAREQNAARMAKLNEGKYGR